MHIFFIEYFYIQLIYMYLVHYLKLLLISYFFVFIFYLVIMQKCIHVKHLTYFSSSANRFGWICWINMLHKIITKRTPTEMPTYILLLKRGENRFVKIHARTYNYHYFKIAVITSLYLWNQIPCAIKSTPTPDLTSIWLEPLWVCDWIHFQFNLLNVTTRNICRHHSIRVLGCISTF